MLRSLQEMIMILFCVVVLASAVALDPNNDCLECICGVRDYGIIYARAYMYIPLFCWSFSVRPTGRSPTRWHMSLWHGLQVESNGGNPGCGTVIGGGGCPSGCNWDVNSCSCGPYQIKEAYFTDCSESASVPINGKHEIIRASLRAILVRNARKVNL